MENVLDWQLWAVLAAAPCFAAWLFGSLHGEARMRRTINAVKFAQRRAASPQASNPSPDDLERPVESADMLAASVPEPNNTVSEARDLEWSDQIVTNIGLNKLREHTNNLRLSARLWDDPEALKELHNPDHISDRVLSHYRGSIDTLEKANAARCPRDYNKPRINTEFLNAIKQGSRTAQIPSISDVTPLSRDTIFSNRESTRWSKEREGANHFTTRGA